jgi:hypothetical protein
MKAERKLRDVDLTVAAFSLLGMINWLSRWYQADGPLDERQIAEAVVDIALNGLSKPAARGRRSLQAA